jgi:ribose 1,5-bisphosphokinase
MKGSWVFVCGPSGSGKDSVIDFARQAIGTRSGLVFSRRMVTRGMQAGSDHDPVTPAAFSELAESGELCWHWYAHGFGYGIARHYADIVEAGGTVVVNGSRAHVNGIAVSSQIRVVQISTSPELLATRLAHRGRDAANAIADRLARNSRFSDLQSDLVIVNDGPLALAGQQLVDYLSSFSKREPAQTSARLAAFSSTPR